MLRSFIPGILALILVVFSFFGLTKLRFETDILAVLPKDLPSVQALQLSQEHFSSDQQLILLVESGEEEIFEEDVAALVEHLRSELPNATVEFRSTFEDNPEAFADGLATLWRSAPAASIEKLRAIATQPDAFKTQIESTKAKIRSSFDTQESTMAAYDPLGFLDHPAINQLSESQLSFQSEDSKKQIILIESSEKTSDYNKHREWIATVRSIANNWSESEELSWKYRITGSPAFNAEIGTAMEGDMSGTLSITFTLIALVFLIIQRQPLQLVLLGALLTLTFFVTLGLGGWLFGTLNLVSVGFAAILLGLVIDYGVVIIRESADKNLSATDLRKKLIKSIGWAAATTAFVFGLLTLSTFNGVRQFGGLIMIGLLAGATLMIVVVPIYLQKFPAKPAKSLVRAPFPKQRFAFGILILCLIISVSGFFIKGLPKVSFDFAMVQPDSSEAAATFETIQAEFPAWSEKTLQLLARGENWNDLKSVAEEDLAVLANLQSEGSIEQSTWPTGFIPNEAAFAANKFAISEIAAAKEKLSTQLAESGFTDGGIALNLMILEKLANDAGLEISSIAESFISETEDGELLLSGTVRAVEGITPENVKRFDELNRPKSTVTGWMVVQARLLPSIKKDFTLIFLPATAILILLLIFVFRSIRDALITGGVLVTTLILVNAFVVLTGSSWNFLNGMAIPLIVGTGIDYSIHLIFCLRRCNGNFDEVWNSVGKAICFCGLSTAIGFGSLMFASNALLQSMGLLCGVGVLCTTLLSVFVIPGLWQRVRR